jgi:hypothetical protein
MEWYQEGAGYELLLLNIIRTMLIKRTPFNPNYQPLT